MAECIVCGKPLGFLSGDEHRRCNSCVQERKWPAGHPNYVEKDEVIKGASQDQPNGNQSASTTFTSIAWGIVFLSLMIASLIALAFARDGEFGTAIIIASSGFFGAVFLGLLAEISSNVARLVNK